MLFKCNFLFAFSNLNVIFNVCIYLFKCNFTSFICLFIYCTKTLLEKANVCVLWVFDLPL